MTRPIRCRLWQKSVAKMNFCTKVLQLEISSKMQVSLAMQKLGLLQLGGLIKYIKQAKLARHVNWRRTPG